MTATPSRGSTTDDSAVTIPVYQYATPRGADYHPGCVTITVARPPHVNAESPREIPTDAPHLILKRVAGEMISNPQRVQPPTLTSRTPEALTLPHGMPHLCAACWRPLDGSAPGMHLFRTSAQARDAVDKAGMGDERFRDGDVLIACDDQAAAILTYATPYAITPQVGEFVSPDGIDWTTHLNGDYAHFHTYAQAALSRPTRMGTVTSAGPNLARGVCVWCCACHRDPVTIHPYNRRRISAALGAEALQVSCAEVNAWLYARRDAMEEFGGDRRGCSGSSRRPVTSRAHHGGRGDSSGTARRPRPNAVTGVTPPASANANLLTADDTYHLFTDALRHPFQQFAVISDELTRVDGDPNGEVTAWSVTLIAVDGNRPTTSVVLDHDVVLSTLCRIGSARVSTHAATADLIRSVLSTSDRELLDDQLCLIAAELAHEIITAAIMQIGSGDSANS